MTKQFDPNTDSIQIAYTCIMNSDRYRRYSDLEIFTSSQSFGQRALDPLLKQKRTIENIN